MVMLEFKERIQDNDSCYNLENTRKTASASNSFKIEEPFVSKHYADANSALVLKGFPLSKRSIMIL